MNPTFRRTFSRATLRLAALLSGPAMSSGMFVWARSNDKPVGPIILLEIGFLLFGIALWAVLNAVYKFTDKLEVATSDPFGLQYQEPMWWAGRTRLSLEKSEVGFLWGEDVPDET